MPIKMDLSSIRMAVLDENGEYKNINLISHIDEVDLTPDSIDNTKRYIRTTEPMEFTATLRNPEGFRVWLLTGNDLYMRFPKKLRRRRRR